MKAEMDGNEEWKTRYLKPPWRKAKRLIYYKQQ